MERVIHGGGAFSFRVVVQLAGNLSGSSHHRPGQRSFPLRLAQTLDAGGDADGSDWVPVAVKDGRRQGAFALGQFVEADAVSFLPGVDPFLIDLPQVDLGLQRQLLQFTGTGSTFSTSA